MPIRRLPVCCLGLKLLQGLESLRDFPDAAHEQHYAHVSLRSDPRFPPYHAHFSSPTNTPLSTTKDQITGKLTAREHHPDEVHEEIVHPEVQKFRSRVCDACVEMIEHAGGIVEDQSVDLTNTNDDLERMTERVRGRDKQGNDEAERSPCKLWVISL